MICLSSSVKTSAVTVYFPWYILAVYFPNESIESTYGWNLRRQVNLLGNLRLPRLDRTLQIHLLDLLAQICCRAEELDEPVLDLEHDVGAFADVFFERAEGFDS